MDLADFAATVDRFTQDFGFRIDRITPADDPSLAVVSRDSVSVTIRATDAAAQVGPEALTIPALAPELVISRINGDEGWGIGRAGMRYRDLIPSRLGGRFIASHIEVCDGGPVPDLVHHHAIRFQLIFCQRGWVDVVYEDQGPAFRMEAGDAVLQPPHIRHRVLASSAGARVVEVGCPAEHDTLFDHELALPTATIDPDRDFGGQRFVRHVGAEVAWTGSAHQGFEAQVTAIGQATDGLADVRVLRPTGATSFDDQGHDGEFDFVFVLAGTATVTSAEIEPALALNEGDAITFPPTHPWSLTDATADLRLLRIRI